MELLKKQIGERVRAQYASHPFPPESRRGEYVKFGKYIRDRVFGGSTENAREIRFLEAGCGTGVMITDIASVLPWAMYEAFDFSQPSIQIAEGYRKQHENDPDKPHLKNIRFYCLDMGSQTFLDIGNTDWSDVGFDFIESWGVIHHTADPYSTFGKLSVLLKPGGWIRVGVYGYFGNRERRHQIEEIKRLTEGLPLEEKIKRVFEYMQTPDYKPTLCRPALYDPKSCPPNMSPATPEEIVDEFLHEHETHIKLSELVQWFKAAEIEPVELTDWDNSPISLRIEDHTTNPVVIKRFSEIGENRKVITPEQAEILDSRARPYWIALLGRKSA